MAKTNGTFKLSKYAKTMIALTKGTNEQRNGWKRMFIDAEHAASIVPKAVKKDSRPSGNYNTNSNSATPAAE